MYTFFRSEEVLLKYNFLFPGFSDLSLNDQMRLLQGSWSEILTLSLCFRSLQSKSNGKLNFATDFNITEQEAKDCGLADFFNHVSLTGRKQYLY